MIASGVHRSNAQNLPPPRSFSKISARSQLKFYEFFFSASHLLTQYLCMYRFFNAKATKILGKFVSHLRLDIDLPDVGSEKLQLLLALPRKEINFAAFHWRTRFSQVFVDSLCYYDNNKAYLAWWTLSSSWTAFEPFCGPTTSRRTRSTSCPSRTGWRKCWTFGAFWCPWFDWHFNGEFHIDRRVFSLFFEWIECNWESVCRCTLYKA